MNRERRSLVVGTYAAGVTGVACAHDFGNDSQEHDIRDTTLSYSEHAHRLAALERALRADGLWETPHPWLTTLVGDSAIERVVQAELATLRPEDLGAFGQVSISAFARSANRYCGAKKARGPLAHDQK